jgi:transcriptional regulator with XRE-family HTH domain
MTLPIIQELRRERRQQGLSQEALANLIGRTTQYKIYYWETGKHDPGISGFIAWAGALGYEVKLVRRQEQ